MEIIERARHFVAEAGRAVDQARFAVSVDGRSVEPLVEALTAYQNDDGGFGHGLEPDIAAPASNPFATELALEYALRAGVSRDHPLVTRTVDYLETTQDDDGGWRFTSSVYEHALAPWFQGWQWPNLNPTCTLAGLLSEFGLGSAQLHAQAEQLFAVRQQLADVATGDFYAVRPYAYYFLAEREHPQRELYRSGLLWWLIRGHLGEHFADAHHFFAYVRSPQTFAGRMLPAEIVEAQLDRLLAEQQADGGWPSPYAPHWRAPSTVDALVTLRQFGRL